MLDETTQSPVDVAGGLPPVATKLDGLHERVQKIRDLKKIFVPYPGTERVTHALNHLLHYGNVGMEVGSPARCLLLTGPSGSGKTALLHRWSAAFPRVEESLKTVCPVLYIEVPPNCSPKALAEHMLRGLGVPEAFVAKGTEVSLTQRVKHHMREQEVRMVILDEFQHFINSENHRIIYKAADFVKGLLNAAICPFVLAGTPEAAAVYEENVQLMRRSFGRHMLKSFDWNCPEDCDLFRRFLDEYEQKLPFKEPSNLARKAIALRIHYFSRGLLGRAVDLLVAATIHALEAGEPCISHDVLRETVENFRDDADPNWLNPFDEPELQPLGTLKPAEAPTRVTRLRKGARKPKQSDLLLT